jgi:Protein of unknown function (DUF3096)
LFLELRGFERGEFSEDVGTVSINKASAIAEPCERVSFTPRFDSPRRRKRRQFRMTLTVAHISPIMSLVAGVLILIMPRLLNLIVAIFLILNGLIGLGLLKWLHL